MDIATIKAKQYCIQLGLDPSELINVWQSTAPRSCGGVYYHVIRYMMYIGAKLNGA